MAEGADPSHATLALRALPPPEHHASVRAAFHAALSSEAEARREAAVDALAASRSSFSVGLLVEAAEQSKSWSTRRRIAIALQQLASQSPQLRDESKQALTTLSRDENPLVARAAQQALLTLR